MNSDHLVDGSHPAQRKCTHLMTKVRGESDQQANLGNFFLLLFFKFTLKKKHTKENTSETNKNIFSASSGQL